MLLITLFIIKLLARINIYKYYIVLLLLCLVLYLFYCLDLHLYYRFRSQLTHNQQFRTKVIQKNAKVNKCLVDFEYNCNKWRSYIIGKQIVNFQHYTALTNVHDLYILFHLHYSRNCQHIVTSHNLLFSCLKFKSHKITPAATHLLSFIKVETDPTHSTMYVPL